MDVTRRSLTYTVAFALGTAALMPLSARAALATSNSTSFSGSVRQSWVCGPVLNGAATCDSSNNFGSIGVSSADLAPFDPSQGVLTGTAIELTSTRTQTLSGTINNGQSGTTITTGTGTSDAKLTAPGVNATFSRVMTSDGVTMGSGSSTSFGPTTDSGTATDIISAVGSTALNNYVGTGTVVAKLATASQFTVASSFTYGLPNKTSSSATYALDWAGSINATYDYVLHAAPALGSAGDQSLTLDFGTVAQNTTASPLSFSLFNLLGSSVSSLNQAGLTLDSISGPVGSPLTTNLTRFSNLTAGSSDPFQAFLDTSRLGDFSATYTLGLSDAAIGTSSSRNTYSLTLNLAGNVAAPVGVPEPSSLALLGAGLIGIGYQWRRRQRTKG